MKVSILTALCNGQSPFVKEAIDSVKKQSYADWEMLILDDASKDDCYSEAIKYQDDRIKVFRNDERMYCANTYQKLLEMATGDICGVLDGDDCLAQNAMERIVGLYSKFKVGWIYTQSWWCNGELQPRRKGLSRLPVKGQLLLMGRMRKHCFSHWRTFKTELRDRRKPLFEKDLKCAVDKSLGYVLEELAPGGFLDECLYYYRYHRENMSHKTAQRPVWGQVVNRAVNRRTKKRIRPHGVVQVK